MIPMSASGNDFVAWQTLHPLHEGDAKWADFDGDGDLDLAVCGRDSTTLWNSRCMTYENQAGALVFRQNVRAVAGTGSDGLAWGDYDGDGDLDLATAGRSPGLYGPENITWIQENDGAGNLLVDVSQNLAGVNHASLAWGDYDGDGDLDLVVLGHDGAMPTATLYRNEPQGTLTPDPGVSLTGLYSGSADWADWDGDGDQDLLTTGYDGTVRRTIFYENGPVGTLTNVGSKGLPGVYLSDAAWGDYDNDGDLDLAFTGEESTTSRHADVYRNDGVGNFSLVVNLLPVYRSSCAWGDYDNDGDLDLAFCGTYGSGALTRIYENTGAGFTQRFAPPGRREGALTWADVDRDGDLDFLVMGKDESGAYSDLLENVGGLANNPPSSPDGLEGHCLVPFPGRMTLGFRWWGAVDAETPEEGLTYCLRVGTSPGANDIVSGTYGTPLMGNVGQALAVAITMDPVPISTTFFWSARTIDSGLEASPWSPEQMCQARYVLEDTVYPIDDAFVDQAMSDSTYGTLIPPQLIVGEFSGIGDVARSYLKFAVPVSADAEIAVAELHVYCINVFCERSYYVDAWGEWSNAWDENTVTWSNAPNSFWGERSDRSRAFSGRTSTWNVTGPVRAAHAGDGMVTIVLRSGRPPEGSGCMAEYASKDQSSLPKPRLRIVYIPTVGVLDEVTAPPPGASSLAPNVPNPFNPSTTIRYQVSRAGPVRLVVYDVSGRLVRRLVDGDRPGGWHTIDWHGRDDAGRSVSSGVYFYRLTASGCDETRKMILAR